MVGCNMTGRNGELMIGGGSTTLGVAVTGVVGVTEAILFLRVGEDDKTICKVRSLILSHVAYPRATFFTVSLTC